jgi:SAM-dependent methyltransferase
MTALETNDVQDAINTGVYARSSVVRLYTSDTLRPAEVAVLLAYRDELRGARILDLGCGAGRLTRSLRLLGGSVVGIDISPAMIARCEATLPDCDFRVGDMRDLSLFDAASFDVVVAGMNLISAVSHEDRLRVLAEVHRVLVPGGVFVFSAHNRNYRDALRGPRIERAGSRARQLLDTLLLVPRVVNHRRNRRYQRFEREYALINDRGLNFRLLHYYLDRGTQRRQLRESGFDVRAEVDGDGRFLNPGDDDSGDAEINYVARRGDDRRTPGRHPRPAAGAHA